MVARCLILLSFFLLLLFTKVNSAIEKYGIGELEINIGEKEGLHESTSIPNETLQRILAGVENGNKDNIYYFGLLKMYGISVSKDLAVAASHFLRASNLGHMEGTTAYGVMLLTGNGVKKDLKGALKMFRKGVELGDMVSEIPFLSSLYLCTNLYNIVHTNMFTTFFFINSPECSLASWKVRIFIKQILI